MRVGFETANELRCAHPSLSTPPRPAAVGVRDDDFRLSLRVRDEGTARLRARRETLRNPRVAPSRIAAIVTQL